MQQLCGYCGSPYCGKAWIEAQQTGLVPVLANPARKVPPCRVVLVKVTFKIIICVSHFYLLQK